MADSVTGIVLAGGRAERLGGEGKAHLEWSGATLVQRVIDRLGPQCTRLIVNLNDPLPVPDGFPVVRDAVPQLGPLGGILAGLEWTAQHAPEATLMASAPVDGPFLPRDLVERLHAVREQEDATIACATSGGRQHGVYALWPVSLAADLRRALLQEDIRSVNRYLARHRVARHEWPTAPADPFFNINTPDDLAQARDIASRHPAF
ncbi:MAG: molybdenum cofactor guanylyltransferase MobA [Xanthobacteraceae bacterium]